VARKGAPIERSDHSITGRPRTVSLASSFRQRSSVAAVAKKAETKPVKGTRDFLSADIYRREHVIRIIREVYEAHGFAPLETPALERLDTLLGKYGDEGDQLLFKVLMRGQPFVESLTKLRESKLEDWIVQGRSGATAPKAEIELADLGLRYDLTVPLARVYADQQGKLPGVFRRYQIQPVWRADNPGKGRFREFYQCDVDVVGTSSLVAEAEVAGAVAECLLRLGFRDFEIKLNHRSLLSAFIESAGIEPRLAGAAIVAVDKLDKVSPADVEKELEEKGIGEVSRKKLLELVLGDADLDRTRALLASNEEGLDALADVESVLRLAKSTPAAEHLTYNPTLARGLGYYTGCIFEIAVKDLAGSLGGGGRYDGLVGMFLGRDVPAVGFSLGLERILVVMEQRNMFPDSVARRPEVLIAVSDQEQLEDALAIAYELRQAGLRVELSPKAEKPGQVRKAADERGVPWAVIVRAEDINLWSRVTPQTTDRVVARGDLAGAIRAQ
jgi:histidyl-tRNA synthetase